MAIIFKALGAAPSLHPSLCEHECGCHLIPLGTTNELCETCDSLPLCGYVQVVIGEAPNAPTVEAAIGHAGRLLELLGFNPEDEESWADRMPAEEFLGRILTALALTPEDEGVPTTTGREGRQVDFGRSGGWLQGKLAELHRLAEFALANGHPIAWG